MLEICCCREEEGTSRTSEDGIGCTSKFLSVCHKQSNLRGRDWRISICLAGSGNIHFLGFWGSLSNDHAAKVGPAAAPCGPADATGLSIDGAAFLFGWATSSRGQPGQSVRSSCNFPVAVAVGSLTLPL